MEQLDCQLREVDENDDYVLVELTGEDAYVIADPIETVYALFPDYPYEEDKEYAVQSKKLYCEEECSPEDMFDLDENGQLIKI